MPELAYVNGVFSPIPDAKVSIEDRGFQFGDGIYEVLVAYHGRPFLLDPHMRRLRRSAEAIALAYDFDAQPLEPIILEGLRQSRFPSTIIYIQLTRGVAPRVHVVCEPLSPTVIMTFKSLPLVSPELVRRGLQMMTTRDTRWAKCYVKAVTLLPNVLAKAEALRKGFDDAIFVADDGEVRECTAANLFVVRQERIITPPRSQSVLHGVTQAFLMHCARAIGLDMREERVSVDRLRDADEVFLSSTTMEVLAITSIDHQPVGDGVVGPITRRLYDEFRKQSHDLAESRPS